jgi:uncharacterized membrane protein YgdD (TMEM256/DUF423 family)
MADARSPLIALGALNAVIAIGAGTFATHGLRDRLDAHALATFETGVRYQMYHAIAIVLAGILATARVVPGAQTAGWLFQAGIVLFSGSLYLLALTGTKGFLGPITPVGGLAFLVGWLWLGWSAWRG